MPDSTVVSETRTTIPVIETGETSNKNPQKNQRIDSFEESSRASSTTGKESNWRTELYNWVLKKIPDILLSDAKLKEKIAAEVGSKEGPIDSIDDKNFRRMRILATNHPDIRFNFKHAKSGDFTNCTLLHWAVINGHTEIAEQLIRRDPPINPETLNWRDQFGNTALIRAAKRGHTEIAKALIDKMSPEKIALQNQFGNTALFWAADRGDTEIAKALIDKMSPEQIALQNQFGDTVLIWAANRGDTEIVKALIDKMSPEKIALQGQFGNTALFWAANRGDTEIATALIDKMSPEKIALQGQLGITALIWAADRGYTEIATALIGKMSAEQIALQNQFGDTALICAADRGYTEIVKALIDKMSPEKIALQGQFGNTALIWAANRGYTEIATALIGKMSAEQIMLPSREGNTALSLSKNSEISKLIEEKSTHLSMLDFQKDKLNIPKQHKTPPISEIERQKIYENNGSLTNFIRKHSKILLSKSDFENLDKLLSYVENETKIVSTPNDAKERTKFYNSMRENLEHIAIKIADSETNTDLKKSALSGIVDSANYCSTRQFQEISLARMLLNPSDSNQASEDLIEKLLYELRVQIVDKMIRQHPEHDNVHTYNAFMNTIGQEVGISTDNSSYKDPLATKLDKSDLLKSFDTQYSQAVIINTVKTAIAHKKIPISIFSSIQEEIETVDKQEHEKEQERLFAIVFKDAGCTELSEEAVPFLLLTAGILQPQENLKGELPFWIKKAVQIRKKKLEFLTDKSLESESKNGLQALLDEQETLSKIPDPQPIDLFNENVTEQDVIDAAEIYGNNPNLFRNMDDENQLETLSRLLVKSGKWNPQQAEKLAKHLVLLEDI